MQYMTPVSGTVRVRPPEFAGIILTYRCTCACRHCLYACSPRWEGWMDDGTLDRAVLGLAALAAPPGVHLAGGEAFLEPGRLLHAVQRVVAAGLEIDFIETNGAWYDDRAEAAALLRELRDAGSPRLLVSATPPHAETIPPARVVDLIELAEEVLGRGNAWAWTPSLLHSLLEMGGGDTLSFGRYLERTGLAAARWALLSAFPMTLAGRAPSGLRRLVPRSPVEQLGRGPCRAHLLHTGHLHFDPSGHHIAGYCTGLALGGIDDLGRVVGEGIPGGELPLVSLLVEEGVRGLLEFAQAEIGFEPDPRGYRGDCHLCQTLRGQLLGRGIGESELRPREFYEELGILG